MSFDILHRVVSDLCSETREYERAAMVDELLVPFAIEGTKYTYLLHMYEKCQCVAAKLVQQLSLITTQYCWTPHLCSSDPVLVM